MSHDGTGSTRFKRGSSHPCPADIIVLWPETSASLQHGKCSIHIGRIIELVSDTNTCTHFCLIMLIQTLLLPYWFSLSNCSRLMAKLVNSLFKINIPISPSFAKCWNQNSSQSLTLQLKLSAAFSDSFTVLAQSNDL